jgi:hypothetical protein
MSSSGNQQRRQPAAAVMDIGGNGIMTHGFGTCSQVDLIDLQSMPNGDFRFLLSYCDASNNYWYNYQQNYCTGNTIMTLCIITGMVICLVTVPVMTL